MIADQLWIQDLSGRSVDTKHGSVGVDFCGIVDRAADQNISDLHTSVAALAAETRRAGMSRCQVVKRRSLHELDLVSHIYLVV